MATLNSSEVRNNNEEQANGVKRKRVRLPTLKQRSRWSWGDVPGPACWGARTVWNPLRNRHCCRISD